MWDKGDFTKENDGKIRMAEILFVCKSINSILNEIRQSYCAGKNG